MWPIILTVSVLSALIAALEVALFGFMGQLVDWFSQRDPATFLAQEKNNLIFYGVVVFNCHSSVGFLSFNA